MAAEKYRLLATAFSLARFTVTELAQAAKVNHNTAASWVKRNKHFLKPEGIGARREGAGRPATAWQLRSSSAPAIRMTLNQLYPEAMRDAEGNLQESGDLRKIEHAEQYVERWRVADRVGSQRADRAKLAAQVSIRDVWRRFAELDAAGVAISDQHLKHVAELEHEIGTGNLPHTQPLPAFANWLLQRLEEMSRQGATDDFAVQVTTTRARVRSEASLSVLTAAALAAPIWLEEGLLNKMSLQTISGPRCAKILEHGNADQMVDATSFVLNELSTTSCPEPEQRQALILGLVTHAERHEHVFPEKPVHHFLAYLRYMNCWGDELAPPLLRGLCWGADSNSNHLVSVLQPALEAALHEHWDRVCWNQSWEPGPTRVKTLAFSQRLLDFYPHTQSLVRTLENLAIREQQGTLENTGIEEINQFQHQLTQAFGPVTAELEAA